jgi:hypothetical protein
MASYSLSKCTLAEYNKPHSATGVVAQIALARLKEMWKIIHGVMWLPGKKRLPRIIFVCCLLHNIVIDMEDKVLDELPSSHQHDTDYRQQICETASKTGIVMGENFLSTFLENHHLQHSLPHEFCHIERAGCPLVNLFNKSFCESYDVNSYRVTSSS